MNKTIDYYNRYAKEFCERTTGTDMSFCQNKFLGYLEKGAKVLDAGCGSGRDSKYFIEKGMQVVALDASEEMCRYAAKYLGQPVECLRFDEIIDQEEFDGIWASASLLHVKKKELPDILKRMYHALKIDGILYASFKYGTKEEQRLERFFSDYSLEEIREVFEHTGLFQILECFETKDIREDYKDKPWVNIIVKKVWRFSHGRKSTP